MNRLTTGIAILAALSAASVAHAARVELRLMETTDIHMHLVDYDYYSDRTNVTVGLARTTALVNQSRMDATNSVLVDNGDLIQGNPLGDYAAKDRTLEDGEIHPAFKAMNLLDYDVGNIGNHEFNYGLEFLEQSLAGANFPYVVANVVVDDGDNDPSNDEPYFQPYVILDKTVADTDGQLHRLRIGYIGFTPPQIMVWDQANLNGRVQSRDIVETAEKYIPQMQAEGADIIVAIPHSGISGSVRQGGDENASRYLAQVDGIDAIMFGHSHRVFPGPGYDGIEGVDAAAGTLFGVPSVMPGFWGSHLGIIDLTLEGETGDWTIVASQAQAQPIYERRDGETVALVDAVPEITRAVRADHEGTLNYMAQRVGETTANINSYFALVQDDPSIQIVNNAQRWYVEQIVAGTEYDGMPILSAAAPFKAGGRGGADYYTEVPAGPIALKNVADLYIYPNDLKVVELSGAEVVEWLERAAGQFNTIDPEASGEQSLVNDAFPSYNFDVIDGLSYRIDVTVPPRYDGEGQVVNDAHRIVDVSYQGQPLDPQQRFLVATNNYRAGGGGSFPNLDGSTVVIDAPDKNRDVVANYLLSQGTLNPSADNNWRFADWGNAEVVFQTSPQAQRLMPAQVAPVRPLDSGFVLYRFN